MYSVNNPSYQAVPPPHIILQIEWKVSAAQFKKKIVLSPQVFFKRFLDSWTAISTSPPLHISLTIS
jgi:hypothetical protein